MAFFYLNSDQTVIYFRCINCALALNYISSFVFADNQTDWPRCHGHSLCRRVRKHCQPFSRTAKSWICFCSSLVYSINIGLFAGCVVYTRLCVEDVDDGSLYICEMLPTRFGYPNKYPCIPKVLSTCKVGFSRGLIGFSTNAFTARGYRSEGMVCINHNLYQGE